jgi:hypothetical protein
MPGSRVRVPPFPPDISADHWSSDAASEIEKNDASIRRSLAGKSRETLRPALLQIRALQPIGFSEALTITVATAFLSPAVGKPRAEMLDDGKPRRMSFSLRPVASAVAFVCAFSKVGPDPATSTSTCAPGTRFTMAANIPTARRHPHAPHREPSESPHLGRSSPREVALV